MGQALTDISIKGTRTELVCSAPCSEKDVRFFREHQHSRGWLSRGRDLRVLGAFAP